MSSLKSHEGFNDVSFISKIMASAATDAFLKGESSIPLSKFREENIPEEEIQKALVELHENSIFGLDGKVNDCSIDSTKIAAICFTGLRLGVTFAGNVQGSLLDKGGKPKPEFDEGRQDHRIGHAVYRCTVTKGIIEEGEPMDYLVNIDRYTIHPDHRGEGAELVFSCVRHIVEMIPVPDAEAGWNYFTEFEGSLSATIGITDPLGTDADWDVEDIIKTDDAEFALVILIDSNHSWPAVFKYQDEAQGWVMVSESKDRGQDCYDFWETALDDLWPGEKMLTTQLTIEEGGSEEEAKEEEKGDAVYQFDMKISETAFSVSVFDTPDCHLYEAIYYDAEGIMHTPRTTNPQKVKTEAKAKAAAKAWLEGVIS